MLLSAFKTQQHIVDAVPDCVKKAIGAGVGMFIAFCGFQSAGLIQKSDSTLVTVGDLSNPGTVLALAGIAITAVLVIRQVKGGILIGILLVTVLGLFVKDPSLVRPIPLCRPLFSPLTIQQRLWPLLWAS